MIPFRSTRSEMIILVRRRIRVYVFGNFGLDLDHNGGNVVISIVCCIHSDQGKDFLCIHAADRVTMSNRTLAPRPNTSDYWPILEARSNLHLSVNDFLHSWWTKTVLGTAEVELSVSALASSVPWIHLHEPTFSHRSRTLLIPAVIISFSLLLISSEIKKTEPMINRQYNRVKSTRFRCL